jgi:hypothetical protein
LSGAGECESIAPVDSAAGDGTVDVVSVSAAAALSRQRPIMTPQDESWGLFPIAACSGDQIDHAHISAAAL